MFKPSLETCFLLLFRQLIRSLVDEGFQIIRVFLHHGHHVVEYVWLPEKKRRKKRFISRFYRFVLSRSIFYLSVLSICIDSLLYTNSIYFKNGFSNTNFTKNKRLKIPSKIKRNKKKNCGNILEKEFSLTVGN